MREGDIVTEKGANWEGSLGLRVDSGLAVSNRHVLPDVGARVVHRVKPWVDITEIGTVIKVSQWRSPSILDWIIYIFTGKPPPANKTDASLIRLDSDVKVGRFKEITGMAEPVKGLKTYKRGRTTGETEGEILEESVTIRVDMGEGRQMIFTDVFMFSNQTLPGDSGGPIVCVTEKGYVGVGITFAGPESGRYGFGIKILNILKEFGVGQSV
ncbi:MAG: trypsin-like serine protease [Nitrososphaerota archaeon]